MIKIKKRSDIITPLAVIKCSGKILWGPYEGFFEQEILMGAKGSLTVALERKYSGPFTIIADIEQDTHLIESIELEKPKKDIDIISILFNKIVYPKWKKVEERPPSTPYPDYPQYPQHPQYPQYLEYFQYPQSYP